MSSCVILKEDQSACQPWELTNFDTNSGSVTDSSADGITLPTIKKIAAIEEQARQEGYDAGHAEGHEKGLAEGREAAARETARLQNLADTFSTEVSKADESISEQVLDLSLDLARALLKISLTINPELVIPIVREAVRYLPALHQPAMLYLNPDDMVLVQDKIGDELTKTGWQIASDTQLEPGSCRVDTAHNQIDASLATRWQRLTTALGKDSSWLLAS
ncbi:MAG: flagellar assembly protein FliH [Thiobacillus sp.]|nr:flagellar assembly protein FliH [Thiobacillus sp.]